MENPFELLMAKMERIETLLLEQRKLIENLKVNNSEEKLFLSVDGLSEFLKISKATVYKYTMTNAIPFYRVGKRVHFKKEEVIQFVEKHRIKSLDEIKTEAANYLSTNKIRRRQ